LIGRIGIMMDACIDVEVRGLESKRRREGEREE
jgi:hypothetical protein